MISDRERKRRREKNARYRARNRKKLALKERQRIARLQSEDVAAFTNNRRAIAQRYRDRHRHTQKYKSLHRMYSKRAYEEKKDAPDFIERNRSRAAEWIKKRKAVA